MKKILGSFAVVLLAVGMAHAVPSHYTETLPAQADPGVVPISNGYDWTVSSGTNALPIALVQKTLVQLNALTPNSRGQIAYCTNCTQSTVCVSSGTGTGAWVSVSSTAVTACF